MMHYHFISPFAIYQGIFMLLILAGYVFSLVIAWRFMRAHESLASMLATLKDTSLSLKPKEEKTSI